MYIKIHCFDFDLFTSYKLYAFLFYYGVGEKHSISSKTNFIGCYFLTKSLKGMGVIFLHWSCGWKDFLYYAYVYVCVCMFVCIYVWIHCRGGNFYIQFKRFSWKMSYVGTKGTPHKKIDYTCILYLNDFSTIDLILSLREISLIKT